MAAYTLQYTREKEREVKEEESRAITEFQVRVQVKTIGSSCLVTLCV